MLGLASPSAYAGPTARLLGAPFLTTSTTAEKLGESRQTNSAFSSTCTSAAQGFLNSPDVLSDRHESPSAFP